VSEIITEKIIESTEFFTSMKRIKINGKAATTPTKVISNSKNSFSESLYIKDKELKKITESYKGIKKRKLEMMRNDSYEEDKFRRDLIRPIERSESFNNINFFLLRYDTRSDQQIKKKERKSSIPSVSEIEYVLDIMDHSYNDFIVTPLVPYLTGEQYISFLDKFLEVNYSFRNKEIGGLISSLLTRDEQSKVLDYYINNDLKIFVFDCYGNSPDRHYSSINMMMRKLKQYDEERNEYSFTIASNVKFGRPHRTTAIAPARDMLSSYSGFDAFAKAHVQKIFFSKPPKPQPPALRFFNQDNYGYEITEFNNMEQIPKSLRLPIFSKTELVTLNDKKKSEILNCINSYNQSIECNEIIKKIFNEESLLKYLRTKDQIPKRMIDELINMTRQTSVSEFFF